MTDKERNDTRNIVSGSDILINNNLLGNTIDIGNRGKTTAGLYLLEIAVRRLLHDICGLTTPVALSLNKRLSNELVHCVEDYISYFSLYRDVVYCLMLKHQLEEEKLIRYLNRVSASKRIDFHLTELRECQLPPYVLTHLLQFAIELLPHSIEILRDCLSVVLRPDVGVHEDLKRMLWEYEHHPSTITDKENILTYKNVYLALFLNHLFETNKKLDIKKMADNVVILSVTDKPIETEEQEA